MTRLAAVEKMQFYPTSLLDVYHICKRLVATGNVRLLDPCAGKGTALAELHAHLKSSARSVTSYAVELDVNRFENCLQHFPATTLNSDWFQVVSSNEAVGRKVATYVARTSRYAARVSTFLVGAEMQRYAEIRQARMPG